MSTLKIERLNDRRVKPKGKVGDPVDPYGVIVSTLMVLLQNLDKSLKPFLPFDLERTDVQGREWRFDGYVTKVTSNGVQLRFMGFFIDLMSGYLFIAGAKTKEFYPVFDFYGYLREDGITVSIPQITRAFENFKLTGGQPHQLIFDIYNAKGSTYNLNASVLSNYFALQNVSPLDAKEIENKAARLYVAITSIFAAFTYRYDTIGNKEEGLKAAKAADDSPWADFHVQNSYLTQIFEEIYKGQFTAGPKKQAAKFLDLTIGAYWSNINNGGKNLPPGGLIDNGLVNMVDKPQQLASLMQYMSFGFDPLEGGRQQYHFAAMGALELLDQSEKEQLIIDFLEGIELTGAADGVNELIEKSGISALLSTAEVVQIKKGLISKSMVLDSILATGVAPSSQYSLNTDKTNPSLNPQRLVSTLSNVLGRLEKIGIK